MPVASPVAAIPAAVVSAIATVAAPLSELLQGLLWGWPQHRGFGRIMSSTKGGHQGQRGSRCCPRHELWSMSDHACRTDRSSGA